MKAILLNLHGARADVFGTYGSSWVTTRHFDRLSAEGLVFDHHYAHALQLDDSNHFADEAWALTLSEVINRLKMKQIPTACFVDERLGHSVRVSHYKHVNVVQQSDLAVLEQPTLTDGIFQLAIDWLQAYGTHYTDWLVTLELGALRPPWNETEYLDPRSQEAGGTDTESDDPSAAPPQFDYQDCGDPEPPPERFGWKNAYAGTLQYVDDLLGQFLTLLKELGIDQECLISVTSFRGQSLGERSSVPRRSQGLYEERIHLPLILRFPGSVGAGRRIHHLTQPVDWFATLAEAFDIKEDLWPRQIPRHSPLRFGPHHSLWRFSQGHGGRPREYVMIEGSPGHKLQEVAVRTPGWYWIMPRGGALGPVQLYRKPEDRWDMNNVLKEHPDVADHLELTWYRYQDWLESGQEGDPPQLRDDVLKGVES